MIEIIPTNTCPPDLMELERRSGIVAVFCPQIQLDIDDGDFAPEISWPYHEGQWAELEDMASSGRKLPLADRLAYETHLMVEDPVRIGELLARVGCTRIIAHLEAFADADADAARSAFQVWKSAGARDVGLALLIDTPLARLDPVASECDVVQLMSIAKLGAQGAVYEPRVIPRIEELHATHPDLAIAIDGGVSKGNIAALARAGASRFGVGSAIFKAPDPKSAYQELLKLAEDAVQ